ncbi:hypothetical protein EVC45_02445 [Paraburkholderia sp. UYCP14C]|uniref:hypothetical protein n=1 Tax=Paraburkholderia sp. UYCP14C TaxID=2511130 RepID=UPI0010224750|nr:hypothetical protein [Paraburkholderia sp. UYCP14C]RZF31332.1 hypothetical protein EVC45_02445 [Paraburkholderia sp. UYCP14C]
MGIGRRNTVPAEPKDPAETATFFGAGKPAEGQQQTDQASTPAAPKEPAGTFFSNRHTDPLTELSTHRARGWSAKTEQERAARKQEETERARRGMDWFMSVIRR